MAEISFTYIRNRIREFRKEDLLQSCYHQLENNNDQIMPKWFIFLLMKWTYLYAGEQYPSKELTRAKFEWLLNLIANLNNDHVSKFIKAGQVDRAFHILSCQQFYLQKRVSRQTFTTQLKLYKSLPGRYDINHSFETKTGLSIFDFVYTMQAVWLCINASDLGYEGITFNGYLSAELINVLPELTSTEKINRFLNLLVLDPANPKEKINEFQKAIRNEDLQSLETTFFTLYPFQNFNNQIRLVHKSVFNYAVNYYLYDFLKSTDDSFTTEFGKRFEKYVELGVKETGYKFKNESQLKEHLPQQSKVVDFFLADFNIYIESKTVELQPYPSINPTDDLLFGALKDSVLKAYFEQMLPVAVGLSPEKENWGIIITYKELFWSHFSPLFKLGKDKYPNSQDSKYLPPENVFIMDVYTWDKVVQIVKNGTATLLEILKKARLNNLDPKTAKQSFGMHLKVYGLKKLELSYLEAEIEELRIRERTNKPI